LDPYVLSGTCGKEMKNYSCLNIGLVNGACIFSKFLFENEKDRWSLKPMSEQTDNVFNFSIISFLLTFEIVFFGNAEHTFFRNSKALKR
jgi:hypothetical protein